MCVSFDTLNRHIQSTVERIQDKGLLQGLNPDHLTVFTVDNIDFLHSHAQVFSGNQNLSYHGTTVQAIQTKPSLNKTPTSPLIPTQPLATDETPPTTVKRLHALVSPTSSPNRQSQSPAKRVRCSRARTGTEFQYEKSIEPHRHTTFIVMESWKPVLR